jgi:hypothetical protein
LLTKYYSDDKIEKNEIGGACSAYGRQEGRGDTVFWWVMNLRERGHLEDRAVDGKKL